MANFTSLNLSRALAEENEEDELDRLIAGHNAAPDVEPEAPANGFDDTLSDLLDDDDDEYSSATADKTEDEDRAHRGGLVVHAPVETVETEETEEALAPVEKVNTSPIGRKGEANPHGPTNPERVTEVDAYILAVLALVRCASPSTIAMLQFARFNPRTRANGKSLTSPATIADRLKKLKRLKKVYKFTNPVTGEALWSATDSGISSARGRGFLERDESVNWGGAEGMGFTQISHYAAIALVAAKIISPAGFYQDVFGTVNIDQIVNEGEIRRVQKPVAERLNADAKKSHRVSFGEWRLSRIDEVMKRIEDGKLGVQGLLEMYPELWTMGQPAGARPTKGTHHPDLVISLEEGRTGLISNSIAIEVELTIKATHELEAILRTIKLELDTPLIYGKVVYFGPAKVEKKLRAIDAELELGLFDSERFIFLPLTDGEGNPVSAPTRVGA